jgi:uncharacterized damage-inducible protein DinB
MSDVQYDEHGRPEGPTTGGEVEMLLGFLDYQRATFAWKCSGLSDEQLRASLPPTSMSLGGMLMHLARVEDHWFSDVVAEGGEQQPWAAMEWAAEWRDASARSGESLRAAWAASVERSRAVVTTALAAGASALEVPHSAWGGAGQASLRWVLVHMVEEYARHNGHADLLRESIDGETGE